MTEIERPFVAAKGNLVQCPPPLLLLCYVIISNVNVCSFECTISHKHRRARKTVLCAKKIVIYEGLL